MFDKKYQQEATAISSVNVAHKRLIEHITKHFHKNLVLAKSISIGVYPVGRIQAVSFREL